MQNLLHTNTLLIILVFAIKVIFICEYLLKIKILNFSSIYLKFYKTIIKKLLLY